MPTIEPDAPDVPDTVPTPQRKQNSEVRLYLILAAIVVVGFSVMFLLDKAQKNADQPVPAATPVPPIGVADIDKFYDDARHKKGDPKATFTIVEFADFQCPSCRRAYEQTISNWDNKIPVHRFGFYQHPLVGMHERAMPAAIASEAADKQGKFWEMYTEFFQKDNEDLTDKIITDTAKKIGLDMTKFQADQQNPAALQTLINNDVQTAESHGFGGTPAFLIHDASGNTVQFAGAGNLKRLMPDLKDGILGNDKIKGPDDPTTKPEDRIHYNIGGKQDTR